MSTGFEQEAATAQQVAKALTTGVTRTLKWDENPITRDLHAIDPRLRVEVRLEGTPEQFFAIIYVKETLDGVRLFESLAFTVHDKTLDHRVVQRVLAGGYQTENDTDDDIRGRLRAGRVQRERNIRYKLQEMMGPVTELAKHNIRVDEQGRFTKRGAGVNGTGGFR